MENAEAFSVYFGLLSRVSPFGKRGEAFVVRPPGSDLGVGAARAGTLAFVAVMLGSVAFDGFSRSTAWQDRYYSVQVDLLDSPGLADTVGSLMNLGGLLAASGLVAPAFRLAVATASWVVREPGRMSPPSSSRSCRSRWSTRSPIRLHGGRSLAALTGVEKPREPNPVPARMCSDNRRLQHSDWPSGTEGVTSHA